MADLTGVGPVAELLNSVVSWLLSADGYATWKRDRKLAALREAVVVAINNDMWGTLDLLLAEYKKLRADTDA
jgi:hypothetical protein